MKLNFYLKKAKFVSKKSHGDSLLPKRRVNMHIKTHKDCVKKKANKDY
jgi:hypothetical protein